MNTLGIVALGFATVAIIVAVVLAYLYLSLQVQIPRRIQDAQLTWRAAEIETLRREQAELAKREAEIQLAQWRENERETMRAKFAESVTASAETQFAKWRSQDEELIRQQATEIAVQRASVEFEKWKSEYTEAERADAIKDSQAVNRGKVTEHFIPLLDKFFLECNLRDARFLGSPVDFIIFDGLTDGDVKRVVFVEVKSGKSGLSMRERDVREAVIAKNVEWREVRFPVS